MLRQLSIHNRSAGELRQLAIERRELAATKTGSVRALLLKEAQLLEFQVELRTWVEQSNHQARPDGRKDRPLGLPSIPHYLGPLMTKLSSRLGLATADQQAFLATASLPKFVAKEECLIEQGEDPGALIVVCSGMTQTIRTLADGKQQ